MPYQSGSNIIVAGKVQSALGTPATGASGIGMRINRGSQGMRLSKSVIENNELRRDGQSTRGRHGSRMVSGSYVMNAAVGALDTWLEAVMRSTWTAAATRTYDGTAGLTSLAVTQTNEITQVGSTSLLGAVYVGDLIKLGSMSTAANNDIWVRVTNVTATVITLADSVLTVQAADSACTLTVARKLVQGSTPTERYFTIDEYYQDLDLSWRYTDCKFNRLEISAAPNEHVVCTFGLLGLDGDDQTAGASPVLTSPTFSTALPLVLADGKIRIEGVDYADLTGFNLTFDLGGAVPPVLAANPPDVFLNNARISGSVTGLRTDADFFNYFDDETQLDIALHMIEVGDSNPKDFLALYMGNCVFDGNDAPLGGDGPLVETIPFRAGKDEAGNPYDSTMIKFCTSAA